MKRMTMGAAAVAGLLALGACGSHVEQAQDAASSHSDALHEADGGAAVPQAAYDTKLAGRAPASPAPPLVVRRSLIHTGEVDLRSDDVARAAAGVRRVASRYAGRIDDERSRARHGALAEDMLTVRVPSAHFAAAFGAIKGLGTLRSATSSVDDVTTQVIDVRVRLQAERSSLHRIEQLMNRAQTLGQVIELEGQLTRRQAALNALEQRQAYLRDQTSLSTITVDISRTPAAIAATHHAHHRTGFLGGLRAGWHALVVTATAVAAGVGAALPFGVPLLVLGVPAWLLIRRSRRRRPAAADAPTT